MVSKVVIQQVFVEHVRKAKRSPGNSGYSEKIDTSLPLGNLPSTERDSTQKQKTVILQNRCSEATEKTRVKVWVWDAVFNRADLVGKRAMLT